MRACLGRSRDGWIALSVSDDTGATWSGALSATPTDPLVALTVLAATAANGLYGRVELNAPSDRLVLRVDDRRFEVRGATEGDDALLTVNEPPAAVAVALWRALRELEARFDEGSWPHPFPGEALARLSSALLHPSWPKASF